MDQSSILRVQTSHHAVAVGLPVLVARHGSAAAGCFRGDVGAAGGGLWPRNTMGGGVAKPAGGDGLGFF